MLINVNPQLFLTIFDKDIQDPVNEFLFQQPIAMKQPIGILAIFLVFNFFGVFSTIAQPWNLEKEEDGIKIYTRRESNSSLKSYKGVAIFHAPMEKVCAMIGNAKNFDWWGEDFKNIKVLSYEEKKYVRYYYIYDMPWPFTDRDLAVEVTIKTDSATGEYIVVSKPLLMVVPEKPDLVRIKKNWQIWTILQLDKGNVKVTLEGVIDPGGNIPDWFCNILTTEMPLKTIRSLRNRVYSPKPANK